MFIIDDRSVSLPNSTDGVVTVSRSGWSDWTVVRDRTVVEALVPYTQYVTKVESYNESIHLFYFSNITFSLLPQVLQITIVSSMSLCRLSHNFTVKGFRILQLGLEIQIKIHENRKSLYIVSSLYVQSVKPRLSSNRPRVRTPLYYLLSDFNFSRLRFT